MASKVPDDLPHGEVLARYVGAFADELAAAGVEDVCLCPGSRSTPLALTFARHPRLKLWTHLDERSCAYFALGIAKASRRPAAILCSSGTAALNFAPAVVEAYHAHVPLIVLTADRPQELRDLGSNQTIDQVKLYGTAVKWWAEMLLPEASEQALRYVRMAAARAAATAAADPAGPVHLNFPFREPLTPAASEMASEPAFSVTPGHPAAGPRFEMALDGARRPLLVLGPGAEPEPGLLEDAAKLGVPVLADALSGARACDGATDAVLGTYDGFLRHPGLCRVLRPDLIIRLGAPPTSKPLATHLQIHRDVRQIAFAPHGLWLDPDLTAAEVVIGHRALRLRSQGGAAEPSWLPRWRAAEASTLAAVACALGSEGEVDEVSAVLDLAAVLPSGGAVFAGNSMPVRDVDSFWPAGRQPVRFFGNRGAGGIDGVLSSALGVAAASKGPLVLLIGDLSFYHDMNGLLAAKRFGLSATIVLINNDGGGIFSFLPQHDQAPDQFEALFGTPHGLDFSAVSRLYEVGFQRVGTRSEYRQALEASLSSPGVQVIEIRTDREANLKLHQRIWNEVAKAVQPLAEDSRE